MLIRQSAFHHGLSLLEADICHLERVDFKSRTLHALNPKDEDVPPFDILTGRDLLLLVETLVEDHLRHVEARLWEELVKSKKLYERDAVQRVLAFRKIDDQVL